MAKKITIKKRCPNCLKGQLLYGHKDRQQYMYYISNSLGSYYPHFCDKCDYKSDLLNETWPQIRIEYDSEEEEWDGE